MEEQHDDGGTGKTPEEKHREFVRENEEWSRRIEELAREIDDSPDPAPATPTERHSA